MIEDVCNGARQMILRRQVKTLFCKIVFFVSCDAVMPWYPEGDGLFWGKGGRGAPYFSNDWV